MPACIIVVFSLLLIVIDNMSCSTNRILIGIVDGASTTTTSSSVSRRQGLFGRRINHEDLIHTHDDDDDDEYDEYSYDRFNNNFFNKNIGNDPKVVEEEEECVTNFYSRVRAKRRAILNGPQFDSCITEQHHHPTKPLDGDNNDDIVTLTSSYSSLSSSWDGNPQGGVMNDYDQRYQNQLLMDYNLSSDGDSSMARSVRGGGGSSSTARRPSSHLGEGKSFWGMRPQDNTDRRNSRSSSRSSSYFHTPFANNDNNMEEEDSCFPPQEEDDELININECFQDNYHTNEDYHQHHCLGLLRVPCSIAINSGEDSSSSSSQQYHHNHHVKTTSVSAYVDTGAQVTVISAAAAKRAGIYHLMDRRYAGRATGVGHCRVLGRIPARHVYFLLGGNEDKQVDDDDWRDVRGGGGSNTSYDLQDKSSSSKNVMVQMDGPALTVLEGTVTKGVDVLLGLDVLQDWEAEIRMGSNKSITVREKKRRGGASVVIPFATSSTKDAGASLRSSGGVYTTQGSSRSSSRTSFYNHLDHPRRRSNNINSKANMCHATDDNDDDGMDDMDLIDSDIVEGLEEEYDEDADDYDDLFFSPTSTDIESDLDLLDKSGHEFPFYDDISSGSSSRRSQTSSRSSFFSGGDWAASNDDTDKIRRTKMTVHDEKEDKLSATIVRYGDGGKNNSSIIQDEKYELDDMNDDVDYDDEEKIDMSGL